jgi:hypothetical protein
MICRLVTRNDILSRSHAPVLALSTIERREFVSESLHDKAGPSGARRAAEGAEGERIRGEDQQAARSQERGQREQLPDSHNWKIHCLPIFTFNMIPFAQSFFLTTTRGPIILILGRR